MMMKRTTEQITDVSCGNTAAFVGIEQFLLKDWHSKHSRRYSRRSQRRDTRSPEDYSEIQGQTREHSKLINFLGKKQICIHVNKMDCDTADSKQYKYVNQESQSEHPQPSETVEIILDGTSGTDGANSTSGTNEMTENEYD